VVEDNAALRDLVMGHLRARGFTVDAAISGLDALQAALSASFDAVILDLGLPDMDGLEVLRGLRSSARGDIPVLILTARDAVDQRVAGLDAGADDYILKPFQLAELDARLRAVLRRPGKRLQPVYRYEALSFDTASRTARHHQAMIELTPREAAVFEELVRTGDGIVVRDALCERLFGFGEDVSPNALEAIVSRLRRKLSAAGSAIRIESMRGIGYRLKSG